MSGPYYNPPVPYSGSIHGGFLPGRMVRVQGRVNPSAHRFHLNLQTGPNSNNDDIALHVNPRFDESVIVRNALVQSSWGSEERHGPPMPIARDQNFEILVLCESTFFKIAVNGQHFSEFTHRIQPLDRINHLTVEGDITISLIQFDGTSQPGNVYGASAPPDGGYAPYHGGGLPYPPATSGIPSPGFTMPPQGQAPPPYPAPGASPYPPPQQQPAYGGYPPAGGAPPGGYYPPPQQAGYPPPQQPGYPPPGQHGYPPQGQQGYPPPGQPGYYQPTGAHGSHGGSGGGILGDASKLLAGGLAGVGLGKVASKIPGMGGGHGHGGHHGGHGSGGGLGGAAGGILGSAAALGIGGALANKGMKKHKKNNLLKYGVPVGGAVLGGYALKKGMKGFGHHGGSSSSSSSSSEEE